MGRKTVRNRLGIGQHLYPLRYHGIERTINLAGDRLYAQAVLRNEGKEMGLFAKIPFARIQNDAEIDQYFGRCGLKKLAFEECAQTF